jgi:glutamate synthase domain-containing protein 2
MRTTKPVISWDEILICGAQLATLPLNETETVSTRTVIGPNAAAPLVLDTPVYVSHMSYGALSREVKLALAKGSAAAGTAMCSGEGGVLPESMAAARRYIFEYVPNRYSVTDENLQAADAIEIKIGQSAKPGLGGHLPGSKVTEEIAEVRGFPPGVDIISPAHFTDITDTAELEDKVKWLRETSGGKPVGIKLAAGHLEADLEVALAAKPDFITVDGRAGATGAAPKVIKDATAIPSIYALARARRALDSAGADGVSLVITGGLRTSADAAKALAMGADAVALASAALMAAGCQQYRICHTGKCPVGITTQDPRLRARLDVELSARRVENFLVAVTRELEDFARLTGNSDVHRLTTDDLRTTSSEIADHTTIKHAGVSATPG